MKKLFVSVVVCLLFLTAASAFAQSGLADIEKMVREQEAKLATVGLALLHFDITAATGRALRAFEVYRGLEKKIKKLSDDQSVLCTQLPAISYRQTLREVQVSAALVVELMDKVAPLIAAGGTPSEGMKKLMAGDLAKLMRTIAEDGEKLQSLFSDLETSCSKEG